MHSFGNAREREITLARKDREGETRVLPFREWTERVFKVQPEARCERLRKKIAREDLAKGGPRRLPACLARGDSDPTLLSASSSGSPAPASPPASPTRAGRDAAAAAGELAEDEEERRARILAEAEATAAQKREAEERAALEFRESQRRAAAEAAAAAAAEAAAAERAALLQHALASARDLDERSPAGGGVRPVSARGVVGWSQGLHPPGAVASRPLSARPAAKAPWAEPPHSFPLRRGKRDHTARNAEVLRALQEQRESAAADGVRGEEGGAGGGAGGDGVERSAAVSEAPVSVSESVGMGESDGRGGSGQRPGGGGGLRALRREAAREVQANLLLFQRQKKMRHDNYPPSAPPPPPHTPRDGYKRPPGFVPGLGGGFRISGYFPAREKQEAMKHYLAAALQDPRQRAEEAFQRRQLAREAIKDQRTRRIGCVGSQLRELVRARGRGRVGVGVGVSGCF